MFKRPSGISLVILFLSILVSSCLPVDTKVSSHLNELNEELYHAIHQGKTSLADSLSLAAIALAKEEMNPSALIDAVLMRVSLFFHQRKVDDAHSVLLEYEEFIQSNGSVRQLANMYILRSNIYTLMGRPANSVIAIEEALRLVENLEDPEIKATIYAARARNVMSAEDQSQALSLYYQSLKIMEEMGNFLNAAIIRENIASLHFRYENYEQSILEYKKARDIYSEHGYERHLARIYNNLSAAYMSVEDYEESVHYLIRAIDLNEKQEANDRLRTNYFNLGNLYLDIDEYENAESSYRQSLSYTQVDKNSRVFMNLCLSMADLMHRTGRYAEAEDYLFQGKALAYEYRDDEARSKAWMLESEIYEKTNRLKKSIQALRQWKVYKDRIFEQVKRREFEEVSVAYEVDLRIAENTFLRQELSYQARVIRNREVLLVLLFGTSLVVLVSIGFLIKQKRSLSKAFPSFAQKNKQIIEKNKKLELLHDGLKTASRQKDKLVNVIVKDLRIRMDDITKFVERTKHSLSEDSLKDFHSIAVRSIKKLVVLISSLKDIQLLEKKSQEPESENISVDELVKQSIEGFRLKAEKKGISIDMAFETMTAETKVFYLQRIIDNLLSNAIKYSPKDSTVRVNTKKRKSNQWQFIIEDQGPGFTEKDKAKMFQMFGKLSAKPTAGEDSNGLGLYTVKRLINRMNGTIDLKSVPGQGSTFICTFPVSDPV